MKKGQNSQTFTQRLCTFGDKMKERPKFSASLSQKTSQNLFPAVQYFE
jgi:hypothetical protein